MIEKIWALIKESWPTDPFLQAGALALMTFILEDPTTIFAAALVAQSTLSFEHAFLGLASGIIIGDIGLYFLGVLFRKKMFLRLRSRIQFFSNIEKLPQMTFSTLFMTRFIPGSRLPLFSLAGFQAYSFPKFIFLLTFAGCIWVAVLLKLGTEILSYFQGPYFWASLCFLFFLLRFLEKKLAHWGSIIQSKEFSLFELWPPVIYYLPVFFYYFYLCFRFRSFTLPSISNPHIFNSGVMGESKLQILNLIKEKSTKDLITQTFFFKKTSHSSRAFMESLEKLFLEKKLSQWPIVLKPDHGERGRGVHIAQNHTEAENYFKSFPMQESIIIQEFCDYPHEAGIMYYRAPTQKMGSICSITLKIYPSVLGNGQSTLKELIMADPRAKHLASLYFKRFNKESLNKVVPLNEKIILSEIGNHCQGAIFKNGNALNTPALEQVFEKLSRSLPEFYIGRFDLKFKNPEDFFEKGHSFKIVEINAGGAEPTHIWDKNETLWSSYKSVFWHWRTLFELGAHFRKQGHKPIGSIRFLLEKVKSMKRAKLYPQGLLQSSDS